MYAIATRSRSTSSLPCGPNKPGSAAELVKRLARDVVILAAVLALLAARAGAADRTVLIDDATGSRGAREALELCARALNASGEQKDDLLERGLAIAESAVAADEGDAKAHFAVFCNLGRKLDSKGPSVTAVSDLRRLEAEVERALEIAPGFVDATVGKSLLLARLPWFMGGDREEANRLMQSALERAPEHPPVHRGLAELLEIGGDHSAAEREQRIAEDLAARSEARHAAVRRGPKLASGAGDAARSGS